MGQYAKLYNNRRWRKKRAAQLLRHPLCKMCLERGVTTVANVVDHREPHRGDPVLFWEGELDSLCDECHNRHKKMMEQGIAMGCDADGLPLDNKHPWNK